MQVYKSFGFCSGQHLIVVSAQNLHEAQMLAIKNGADLDIPLTQVTISDSWNTELAKKFRHQFASGTIH